jgi:hypothetical protein
MTGTGACDGERFCVSGGGGLRWFRENPHERRAEGIRLRLGRHRRVHAGNLRRLRWPESGQPDEGGAKTHHR